MVLMAIFLRIKHRRTALRRQIIAMDWPGIILLTGSLVAIVWAIFSGGVLLPWGSAAVLSALIVGIAGLALFIFYTIRVAGQHRFFPVEPVVPARIFGSRTAGIGYFIVFVHALALSSVASYFPLYVRTLPSSSGSSNG